MPVLHNGLENDIQVLRHRLKQEQQQQQAGRLPARVNKFPSIYSVAASKVGGEMATAMAVNKGSRPTDRVDRNESFLFSFNSLLGQPVGQQVQMEAPETDEKERGVKKSQAQRSETWKPIDRKGGPVYSALDAEKTGNPAGRNQLMAKRDDDVDVDASI